MDVAFTPSTDLQTSSGYKNGHSQNMSSCLLSHNKKEGQSRPGQVQQKEQYFSNSELCKSSQNALFKPQGMLETRQNIILKESKGLLFQQAATKNSKRIKSPKKDASENKIQKSNHEKSKKSHLNANKQRQATKQLIELNNSEFIQWKSQQPKPKAKGAANNRLEGWETKNSSHHFFVDKCGNICEGESESRPISRGSRVKNAQFETEQFLKQIKLKYAKALKFRQSDQQKRPIENCVTEPSPILIEDDQYNQRFETIEPPDTFVKYSQRKTLLNLKKIVPDADKSLRNVMNTSRDKTSSFIDSLADRVNHDILLPRPQSRIKSRMSSKFLTASFEKVNKKSARHMTIDSSQLGSKDYDTPQALVRDKKKSQYIGYKKSKKLAERHLTLQQSPSNRVLEQSSGSNVVVCNKEVPAYQNRRNRATKIKLKYLKSLKYGHYSHLSTIEPQKFENAKIQPQITSMRTLKTDTSVSNLLSRNSANGLVNGLGNGQWEARISARGQEEFRRLRKLLQKEEEPAYLICQKEGLA